MISPETIKTVLSEWPKWVATGILIPVVQFSAGLLWKMRRKTRAAELRKKILELEDFITKHQALEGKAHETVISATAERNKSLDQLRKLDHPFSEQHAYLAKLARFFLLYPPRYLITWITRFLFFSGITISLLRFQFISKESHAIRILQLVGLFLGALLYSYLTRAADRVTGPITPRPLWRRISLLYRPQNIAGGLTQFLFLTLFLASLDSLYLGITDEFEASDVYGVAVEILFTVFYWYLSYHLDRKDNSNEPVAEARSLSSVGS